MCFNEYGLSIAVSAGFVKGGLAVAAAAKQTHHVQEDVYEVEVEVQCTDNGSLGAAWLHHRRNRRSDA